MEAGNRTSTSESRRLIGGEAYPITIEMFERTSGQRLIFSWSINGLASTVVPSSALRTPSDASFAKNTWTSITARVNVAGAVPDRAKVGIMIRDTADLGTAASSVHATLPRMEDPQAAYAALLFHPNRGVFTQFRGKRADTNSLPTEAYFVGQASQGGSITSTTDGVVIDPIAPSLTRTGVLIPEPQEDWETSGSYSYQRQTNRTYRSKNDKAWEQQFLSAIPPINTAEGQVENVFVGGYRFKSIYEPRIRTRHGTSVRVQFALDSADPLNPLTADAIFRSDDLQRDTSGKYRRLLFYNQDSGDSVLANYEFRTNRNPRWTIQNDGTQIQGQWNRSSNSSWELLPIPPIERGNDWGFLSEENPDPKAVHNWSHNR